MLCFKARIKKGLALSEEKQLSVEAAQACIFGQLALSGIETVSLEASLGRVLAEDIFANRDQPPFDVSAMDGFAVRSSDLADAAVALSVIEDIKAGDLPQQTVQRGQCSRIMTGAPVPSGAVIITGDRVCGMHDVGTKEKALTARLRKGLKNLVAGAGFEPTTFGL